MTAFSTYNQSLVITIKGLKGFMTGDTQRERERERVYTASAIEGDSMLFLLLRVCILNLNYGRWQTGTRVNERTDEG